MMLDAGFLELAAVRTAFNLLVARWRLSQKELRELLVITGTIPCARVLPDELDVSAETRVRLLLRLDRAIAARCVGADVGALLRMSDPASGRTPLHELRDLRLLRAAVNVAEQDGDHRGGGDR